MMQIQSLRNSMFDTYPDIPQNWFQEWLLYVLDKPYAFLITDSDYQLSSDELARFKTGLERMQAGTPLAYLLGRQAFWSLEFFVNEHTLIPRPDTEILVEQVLSWIKDNDSELSSNRLLDLGTGSGCIAISLAHELSQIYPDTWEIVGVDSSKEALEVARQNIELNQSNHVSLRESNWYDALKSLDNEEKFAVIVSNPPYIDCNDEHLPDLKAEPITALVANNQGLSDIEEIISRAGQYLEIGGLLAIEHGYDQADSVKNIFSSHGFDAIKTIRDYGNNDRVTMGMLLEA